MLYKTSLLLLALATASACERKQNQDAPDPMQSGREAVNEPIAEAPAPGTPEYESEPMTEQAVEGEQEMAQGEQGMAQGEQQMAEGDPLAAEGQQQTAEGEQQMTEGEQQAAEGEQQMAQGEEETAAAETQQQAAEGEQQTAEGEQQAIEGEQQMAEGEDMTTEGEALSAEGEQQAAEGEQQMAEGEDMTAEGEQLEQPLTHDALFAASSDLTPLVGRNLTLDEPIEVSRVIASNLFFVSDPSSEGGNEVLVYVAPDVSDLQIAAGDTLSSLSGDIEQLDTYTVDQWGLSDEQANVASTSTTFIRATRLTKQPAAEPVM